MWHASPKAHHSCGMRLPKLDRPCLKIGVPKLSTVSGIRGEPPGPPLWAERDGGGRARCRGRARLSHWVIARHGDRLSLGAADRSRRGVAIVMGLVVRMRGASMPGWWAWTFTMGQNRDCGKWISRHQNQQVPLHR